MAKSRSIGGTEVYPVGLGCMNVTHAYGEPMEAGDALALLRHALEVGYTLFDTATL